MTLQFTQITGSFEDGQGNALSGTATFTPNTTVYAAGVPVVEADVPITAQIIAGALKNSSGGTLQLLATDNAGLTYAGQTGFLFWTVAITLSGQVLPSWSFFLPHTPSPVDLFALANTGAGGGGGAVSSVFTRTGAVAAASGDYTVSQVTGAAPLASPALTGTPTAPTAAALADSTQVATTAYADSAVAVETARAEAAEAATLPLAGGTMSGPVAMGGSKVTGLANGSASGDAVALGQLGSAAFQASSAFDAAGAAAAAEAASVPLADLPLSLARGGTGQVTQQAAIDALAGAVTASQFPRGNGTHVQMSAIQPGDLASVTDEAGYAPLTLTPSGAFGWGMPWQFNVLGYGAKGDGKVVTDAAMTSGSNVLTCATSTPFTSTAADGGKAVYVAGAGAAGAGLYTTISTVTDSGHAVLAANAGTAVSGKGAVFGTDDTAAVKSAVNAAVTYAQTARQYAEVIFPPLLYVLASAATTGATYQTNAIIPLPVIASSAAKVTLVFKGLAAAPDALPHWLQGTAQMAGACLAVLNGAGVNDATYGPPFTIAGPWNTYGDTGTFSNMCVVVDGLTVSPPFNGTYGGFGFWGVAEARVLSASYMPMGIVPSGGAFPQFDPNSISNQITIGLLMPAGGNNDLCDVQYFSAYGATYGFMPSEHTTFTSVRCNYCIGGISPVYGGGNVAAHAAYGKFASAEACVRAVYPYITGLNVKLGGFPQMTLDCLDIESGGNTAFLLYDASTVMGGQVGFQGPGYKNGYLDSSIVSGASSVKLVALAQSPGPVSSPAAPPASGSAWGNYYYRDAWVTLASSGGTITALTITGQDGAAKAQNIVSAAAQQFLLPSGATYTPAYTGTLTHTVTLL